MDALTGRLEDRTACAPTDELLSRTDKNGGTLLPTVLRTVTQNLCNMWRLVHAVAIVDIFA